MPLLLTCCIALYLCCFCSNAENDEVQAATSRLPSAAWPTQLYVCIAVSDMCNAVLNTQMVADVTSHAMNACILPNCSHLGEQCCIVLVVHCNTHMKPGKV